MGLFDKLLGHPPTPDKFAGMFMGGLKAAGDVRTPQFDPKEFRLSFAKDGKPAQDYVNLRNFYDEYCHAPRGERAQLLQRMVRAALSSFEEPPEDFETARKNLRPKIWLRSMLEQLELERRIADEPPKSPPTQMMGEHLLLGLAYDMPDAVRSITQDELEEWGISFYEAMEIARENLEATGYTMAAIGERLYASLSGDTYDASRLVLLDVIRKFPMNGDPIAMIPNRDKLLLASADDPEGLGMMLDFAEKALNEEPRPLLAMPLRLAADERVDWMPPPDHKHYPRFKLLALQFLADIYAGQKKLLDALHDKTDADIFVASYKAVRTEEGKLFSYCVWSDGVDTLLPQADKVMFFRQGSDVVAEGSWGRVREIVADLMEPTDEYPPRVRVKGFPTAEQLAAIGPAQV